VATWYTIGRFAWRNQAVAIILLVVIVASSGTATLFYPSMAIIQCVAFPLIWVVSPRLTITLVANAALAAFVAFGLAAGGGFTQEAIWRSVFTAALSLGFALALGLWITRIFHLSVEKQLLIDQLQSAQGELAALHRDAGVASERERLARELHDTIAQSLTGLVMLTQGARRSLDSRNWDETASALAMIEDNARDTLAETRALVASGASVEVPGGIIPALQRLAERFERETGVTVTVDANAAPAIARDTEVVLLRCTQEALANVRKHAKASAVTVTVGADVAGEADGDAGGEVTLTVRDDGVGFTPEQSNSGFGLAGMRERLALVNGTLDVESGDGATTLSVRVPSGVSA
jgi:signal transduction histidine kinase